MKKNEKKARRMGKMPERTVKLELIGTTLVVPIGLPGSGKTTLLAEAAAHLGDPAFRFGADDVRQLAFGSRQVQGNPAAVHSVARAVVALRLSSGRSTAYDATSVNARDRAVLLDLANNNSATPVALIFAAGLAVAKYRNASRSPEYRVPEEVIDRMSRPLGQVSAESLAREGFAKVYIIDQSVTELDIRIA
jgi:predicted kinase